MIRRILIVPSLVALVACGQADAGGGTRESSPKAKAPAIDPARVISGVVHAPAGHDLSGAKVLACLTPRETCAQEAEGDLTIDGGTGRFALTVPAPGDYHLTIWKDVNGDGAPNAGDLLAFAHNMEAVPSGQRLSPMAAFVRSDGEMTTNAGGDPVGAAADLDASAQAARSAGLGGSWSQASTGSELVWGPEIKFQAASATTGIGTNLGGTFGAGSATNTTIVYSYKPVQMRRAMTLEVAPDGTFHWVATLQRQTGRCRSIRQEKFGRIAIEGERLTFVVADARQRCGDGAVEALEEKDETYTLLKTGTDAFRLTGEGGVSWSFRRG